MFSKNLQFNASTVYVYVANFDKNVQVKPVQPSIRNQAIQRCTDILTRQQKYCVWQLLDYALKQHYGNGVDGFNFNVSGNGKWSCNANANFSLSHSNNVVVVAIFAHKVGVDVEAVSSFSDRSSDEAFVNRVLNNIERQQLMICEPSRRSQTLALLWTHKESVFKMEDGPYFAPKSIDTTKRPANTRLLEIDGNRYALSVATCEPVTVEINQVGDIWK
ncbi:MAG: 4'-phosphopantetheinyl transferase superfamily protein [Clostridiales bacterium]|nr:4'-phosphopantetheinyl transferase superfamily protein [Clostridiales bacterium]